MLLNEGQSFSDKIKLGYKRDQFSSEVLLKRDGKNSIADPFDSAKLRMGYSNGDFGTFGTEFKLSLSNLALTSSVVYQKKEGRHTVKVKLDDGLNMGLFLSMKSKSGLILQTALSRNLNSHNSSLDLPFDFGLTLKYSA